MDLTDRETQQIRQGISRAALAHDAQIATLQAELRAAYQKEIGMASVVAERRQFSQELYSARLKLDMYREKLAAAEADLAKARSSALRQEAKLKELTHALADAQSKFLALSESVLGALQLRYWSLRRRQGKG